MMTIIKLLLASDSLARLIHSNLIGDFRVNAPQLRARRIRCESRGEGTARHVAAARLLKEENENTTCCFCIQQAERQALCCNPTDSEPITRRGTCARGRTSGARLAQQGAPCDTRAHAVRRSSSEARSLPFDIKKGLRSIPFDIKKGLRTSRCSTGKGSRPTWPR